MPGLQHLTTGGVLKILSFSVQFHNCIFFSGIILLSFTKQNIQNYQ